MAQLSKPLFTIKKNCFSNFAMLYVLKYKFIQNNVQLYSAIKCCFFFFSLNPATMAISCCNCFVWDGWNSWLEHVCFFAFSKILSWTRLGFFAMPEVRGCRPLSLRSCLPRKRSHLWQKFEPATVHVRTYVVVRPATPFPNSCLNKRYFHIYISTIQCSVFYVYGYIHYYNQQAIVRK